MITNRATYLGATLIVVLVTVGVRLTANEPEITSAEYSAHIDRLTQIPKSFGQWRLQSESRMDDRTVQMLRCGGHVNRRYVNTVDGTMVDLILLVGPSGPLLAHTPDVCMSSREFEQIESSRPTSIQSAGETENVFLETAYKARTLAGQTVRLYYGWSRDLQKWEGPEQPRLALGDAAVLYKLQLTSTQNSAMDNDGRDACQVFLADLVSSLRDS